MVGSSYTKGSTVFVSEYIKCGHHVDDFVNGDQVKFKCEQSISGQYVVIQQLNNEPLKLCEVEVYAEEGNIILYIYIYSLVLTNL